MKTIAVVPIKLNNERLPNKNIKPFDNGDPLCHYIFETLKKVNGIDKIYVYCSNPKIKEFIPKGIEYLKRDEFFDQNSTKINEVLAAFAKDVPADIYVMSHATAPFIKPQSIEIGLNAIKNSDFDSAFAVKKIQTFLWKNGKTFNYDLNNIPRTQDLEPIFEETSGFYIYKQELINKHNCRIGTKPFMVEVSAVESCDIDTQEDFDIANAIFNQIIINEK